jgi:hypothetical protein
MPVDDGGPSMQNTEYRHELPGRTPNVAITVGQALRKLGANDVEGARQVWACVAEEDAHRVMHTGF